MIRLENIKLVINNKRKDVYGEVFTHIDLIAEMLITIDKKIWYDVDTNFYDPTCGNGYFLFFVYDILMGNGKKYKGYEKIDGLKNIIPNEIDREKHIIENMIYGTDIQQDNIDFCKSLFKNDDYKTNFICDDYMNFDIKRFNIDIKNIIGNPPFQATMEDGSRKAKNHNLWRPIIIKSFKELTKDGIMSFVCPASWMSLSKANQDMFSIIKKNQILDININECGKYFPGVGNIFSYFTIKKSISNTTSNITCKYKNKIYKTSGIINIDCLPLLTTSNSISILNKVIFNDDEKFNINTDSQLHAFTKKKLMKDKKDSTYKYKLYHTLNMIKWSSVPHNTQNKWKILIPRSTYTDKMFIDYDAGVTQGMAYIVCDDENDAKITYNILQNKVYRYILLITRWGNWASQDVLKLLPKIEIKKWTNNEIYSYFNLSNDEINEIENIITDDLNISSNKYNVDENDFWF